LPHLPDIQTAVDRFLAGFPLLRFLPFLSDREAADLYGPEVNAAVAEMEKYNLEQRVCEECRDRCCLLVKCELYDTRFTRCLVENYRPALCRLHYCDKYNGEYTSLARRLGDIFLEVLLAAQKIDRGRVDLFDCPAFKPLVPQLTARIGLILDDLRLGQVIETEALLMIKQEIETLPPTV
jgi:hypothetical protein